MAEDYEEAPRDRTRSSKTHRRPNSRSRSANRPGSRYASSERIQELATPRRFEMIKLINFGERIWWGTQGYMPGYAPTEAAKNAVASPRVVTLATPKTSLQTGRHLSRTEFHEHSCGRVSPIWDMKDGHNNVEASERVGQLANHKAFHADYKGQRAEFTYSCGRLSPVWDMSKAAMSAGDRPRTVDLARHKTPHRDFQYEQAVMRPVSNAARGGKCSERVDTLSRPKHRPEGPFREPRWSVAKSTRLANASSRNLELAKAKNTAEGHQFDRNFPMEIPKSSKRAIASSRTNSLAVPIIRATMDHIIFDPDAFIVKETAMKAHCSSRTNELAQPQVR